MNRIAVIGAGGWGTALANLMASKGLPVTLWGFEPHHVEELRQTQERLAGANGVPHASVIAAAGAKVGASAP